MVLKKLEQYSIEMREARDEEMLHLQVRVKRRVQPSVEVQIGSRKFRSSRAMESDIISFVDGEVIFQPANFKD